MRTHNTSYVRALFLLVALLVACNAASTSTPTETPTSMAPVAPALPRTATPTAPPTRTAMPTAAAAATSTPVVSPTGALSALTMLVPENVRAITELRRIDNSNIPSYADVDLSADARFMAVLAQHHVRILDAQTGRMLHEIPLNDVFSTITFSGAALLVRENIDGEDATVRYWNLTTGRMQRTLKLTHAASHTDDVVPSPDGQMLAISYIQNAAAIVELRDATSGTVVRTWSVPAYDTRAKAFSPDGRVLAVGNVDPWFDDLGRTHTSAWLWDVATGTLLHALDAPGDPFPAARAVTFSPDGLTLATTGWNKQVRLWDVSTGQLLHTLDGGGDTVRFSPDGRLVASGDFFYSGITAHVWNANTGALLKTLHGHTHGPVDVAFTSDGKLLITASPDGTLRLWGVPAR